MVKTRSAVIKETAKNATLKKANAKLSADVYSKTPKKAKKPSKPLPKTTIKRLLQLRKKYPCLEMYQELVCHHESTAIKQFETLIKQHHATIFKSQTFDTVVHIVQDESGSGVNISDDGLILTCAHCLLATDEDDDDAADDDTILVGIKKLVMFADGRVFEVVCTAASMKRDLAILKVQDAKGVTLPTAKIATDIPSVGTNLICVGNPSEYDLEADDPEARISFIPPVFHCSTGTVDGYCRGDIGVVSDIGLGKLKHGCWTYWGHSGAPLFATESGEVVGLHNSWNERNAQRHGVSLLGLQCFLKEYLNNNNH